MSLSASDNNSASYTRAGKTPPPAPSAAYAKRARELAAEEQQRLGQRYRPPALRAMASGSDLASEITSSASTQQDSTTLPPTNYPSTFRRARAGTLPSNVHLAAQQHFGGASLTSKPNDSLLESAQQRQVIQPPAASGLVARPNLRHSASVASSIAGRETNNRHRSESLTLPPGNLANPFSSSIFGGTWLPSANGSGNGFPVLDDLRSVTSADSGADDFNVHTLDYLGLDDTHRPMPTAVTISELRHQAQAAIAGNLATQPSRLRDRASTVSNPYRQRPNIPSTLLGSNANEAEEYENYDEPYGNYGQSNIDNDYGSMLANKGYRSIDHLAPTTTRPRAISVGNLEDPVRTIQRRATITHDSTPYINEFIQPTTNLAIGSNMGPGALKADNNKLRNVHFTNGGDIGPTSRASAYLLAPGAPNRSVSPKSEGPASQIQTPTRSLWIGNLDSSVTSEQLIRVFAPYGAIESLRLLPEKECGFVNFVDQADAIRAKDDVLNRLGANIGMPNGQTVRIGFGKADSAPVAPAKGSPATPSPSSPSVASGAKSAAANSAAGGLDAQLQSTPTRALWIGSIPSTTTPATILSVFSPYGPIESARVLTHKNCGFINFERLDDAVRARKALNGRDVLGSDVGAIRIGFAKVPVKNGQEGAGVEETANPPVQGIGELSVGATIHALRTVKGASTIPADQQVLSGAVENYRSNLLLTMLASGAHAYVTEGLPKPPGAAPSITEQQMIMKELSLGSADAETDIAALAEFRPPSMYYTSIPLVSERAHNRRWDASKLRELRKRLDSGTMTVEEIDNVAGDFMDGEIVDLASDWLGNTVVQKLFEKCSAGPRFAMLERITPSLAMIGIHKNGTWAAQKIIECVTSPDEVNLIAQHLRAYAPPLLLDQFGNYVVQCCLRFGAPANDFIFDAMVDRMWEVAQGRFGARSMRACLENPHITLSQQRRIATAVILNSIPLATNPNGALLLTWLLDTSNFPSRYNLLAPRFTPHLSHLCTHKLASLTVLRIVNQKIEPEASRMIVEALFSSHNDHVLTDVLGDQVNGMAVIHKILTSPFIDEADRVVYIDSARRVINELKPTYAQNMTPNGKSKGNSVPGLPSGYPSNDQGLASVMAALQMGGQNPQAGPGQQMHSLEPSYAEPPRRPQPTSSNSYAPAPNDPFNPFGARSPDMNARPNMRRAGTMPGQMVPQQYGGPPPATQGGVIGMSQQPSYGLPAQQPLPPHIYQPYMYQAYPQNPPGMGPFHP